MLPDCGTLLVICAFGLNLLTPRIATLVRTDMMLTLWITICGWLIYRKIDSGRPWTRSEKWAFFLAMLAALLTKGPILYAFILPGMAAFWFLGPKDRRSLVWSGWWTWLLASCPVYCMARHRLLDEPGVLQRCRDQGIHEPFRSEP